jgi:hypothetical protein
MLGICLTMGIKCGLKVYQKVSLKIRANMICIFKKFNFFILIFFLLVFLDNSQGGLVAWLLEILDFVNVIDSDRQVKVGFLWDSDGYLRPDQTLQFWQYQFPPSQFWGLCHQVSLLVVDFLIKSARS